MGYSGLDSWECVDGASDLKYTIEKYRDTSNLSKVIEDAIVEEGNSFNPPGFVNLSLLLEANVLSPDEIGKKNLFSLLDKMIELLENNNDGYHDQAYIRLYHVIRSSLKK